ncbi:hypothetical protein RISK_000077 [Rhodopirellula islandica]|uniref:Uncharacterized protein n=1 Tax=Rhodopirellula islandica TaxID=595434 RepID=A0A0J1BN59_RHOIS|nr:hypothetical protein RISK_000077 [Rhodopirellula islandica]
MKTLLTNQSTSRNGSGPRMGWRREASLVDGGELVAGRLRGGAVIEKVKL